MIPLTWPVTLRPAGVRRLLERLPAGAWQVVGGAGWLAAEHAARLSVGLLVGAWVARHLGPEAFGVLNYAISFVFLFSALGRLGLDNLVVRDLVADPGRKGEILGAALVLRLAGGGLAFALIALAALSTQADRTTQLAILIIGAGLIGQSLEVGAYWFYARTFTRPIAVARLLALAVVSALRITFILLDLPVLWFAIPVALDAVLAAVLMLVFYLRRSDSPRLDLRPTRARLTALLTAAWPLTLSVVLIELQLRIDQVMLGDMLSAAAVGWYAAATRLSQMLYVIPTLLAAAVFPTILRAKEASPALYQRRIQSFYEVMVWLGIAVALPGMLLASPLIRLLYGAAYAPSATVLQIHLWSMVFVCVGVVNGCWLVAEGRTRATLVFTLVGVVSNIGFNLLLIPGFGASGAAFATLGASVVSMLTWLWCQPYRSLPLMILKAVATPLRKSAAFRTQAAPE